MKQKRYWSLTLLVVIITCLFYFVHIVPQMKIPQNELSLNISVQSLTKDSERWFIKEFIRCFMSVYENKTFFITENEKLKLVRPNDHTFKKTWLAETAKQEFDHYIINPKKGYRGILIQYQQKPVGVILYRLLENEKIIYLAQFFIIPEFQKRRIATHLLLNTLPRLHPDFNRYEILTRHQNDAALMLYNNAGFSIGDTELVKKYDYDPLRYLSFYKSF